MGQFRFSALSDVNHLELIAKDKGTRENLRHISCQCSLLHAESDCSRVEYVAMILSDVWEICSHVEDTKNKIIFTLK